MQYSLALLSALAAIPAANCIAFGGPVPTDTSPARALDGWTPKPTNGPSIAELRRRQSNLYPETCGWVDGDYSSGVTCGFGRTCMLYTASSIGMAGCCEGGDTQECGWASSCIDYDQYYSSSICDTDCELNTFVRKCSDAASPYCVTWTYPGDNVADYGCADTSFSLLETVYQSATDTFDSYYTSMSLPTISGKAVTGWDETSRTGNVATATGGGNDAPGLATGTDLTSEATGLPSTGGSRKKKGKVSIPLIIGIAVGALVLLFIIGAVVIFLCVKQKKRKQLANNQQAIAAAQASHTQPQFQPQTPQPQMQQAQPPMAPMPPQTPQPMDGYYKPQNPDQKFNPQTQAYEYQVSSPISNPPTPAPAYVQPYYAAPNGMAPPMPTQSPAPYQTREPTAGAHEVDAISVPHAQPGQQGQGGHVYEMGSGK